MWRQHKRSSVHVDSVHIHAIIHSCKLTTRTYVYLHTLCHIFFSHLYDNTLTNTQKICIYLPIGIICIYIFYCTFLLSPERIQARSILELIKNPHQFNLITLKDYTFKTIPHMITIVFKANYEMWRVEQLLLFPSFSPWNYEITLEHIS